jgi:DUF4097 and DUF4098 domain-containing protein YvlB
MPPGGNQPPFPPYDPKTQWRVYRAQQKAAWRAQRDAWKSQTNAWKANYANAYGPRVPSIVGPIILIGVGIVALLLLTGHIPAGQFWGWYSHWWPLLLIGAGLALLAEWAFDMRRKVPVRRGGSFVGILVMLAILGVCAAGWDHARPWFSQWGDHDFGMDNDFFNTWGQPEHDSDQQALSQQIRDNSTIEIENPRGDVSVSAGDGSTIEVQAHQVAYAGSDADAKKIFDAEAVHLTVSGTAVLVKSDGDSRGRVNLAITVPKTASVTINSSKGDVTAAGLGKGITVTAQHGEVHLSTIAGGAQLHFPTSGDTYDFSAHQIEGDITIDGGSKGFTLSEIKGKVTQSGEIVGDVHLEDISGPIHLHTSVTDVQVAELPGDMTLNSDDLHVNEAKGSVRVVTHSKDVDLSQIYGDTSVEDRDGRISIEPAGNYGVNAKNSKGDVEVTLPPNASATVDVHTRNGDIVSDFPAPSFDGGVTKAAVFHIGAGGSKIMLSAENGDVSIKKGSGFPPAESLNLPPKTPSPSAKAPKLKTSKSLPDQPVTQ